jgi:transglutaminase-like putative cysteine protease
LESSEYIDWRHVDVSAKAGELAGGCADKLQIAKRCFEFVRDQILHSGDAELNPVTCRASDVLLHRTGYCYAKSHLLAALLRANGIPTGFCYQRLSIAEQGPPFCLHGLNAAHFEEYGWYRFDARGNKPSVRAEFTPPIERLAFKTDGAGEADLVEIWPQPLPVVICALTESRTYQEVSKKLPDIELLARRAQLG